MLIILVISGYMLTTGVCESSCGTIRTFMTKQDIRQQQYAMNVNIDNTLGYFFSTCIQTIIPNKSSFAACHAQCLQTPNCWAFLFDNTCILCVEKPCGVAGNGHEVQNWQIAKQAVDHFIFRYCKSSQRAFDYVGDLTVTSSCITCQAWTAQSPHSHHYGHNHYFPEGNAAAAGNKCRNSGNSEAAGPWCYPVNPNVRWQFCSLFVCT